MSLFGPCTGGSFNASGIKLNFTTAAGYFGEGETGFPLCNGNLYGDFCITAPNPVAWLVTQDPCSVGLDSLLLANFSGNTTGPDSTTLDTSYFTSGGIFVGNWAAAINDPCGIVGFGSVNDPLIATSCATILGSYAIIDYTVTITGEAETDDDVTVTFNNCCSGTAGTYIDCVPCADVSEAATINLSLPDADSGCGCLSGAGNGLEAGRAVVVFQGATIATVVSNIIAFFDDSPFHTVSIAYGSGWNEDENCDDDEEP